MTTAEKIAAQDAEIIANAVAFNVYLPNGPEGKVSENFADPDEAIAAAKEIEAAHPGRTALISAVDAEGRRAPIARAQAPEKPAKAPRKRLLKLETALATMLSPNFDAGGDAAMARAGKGKAKPAKAAPKAKAAAPKGKAGKAGKAKAAKAAVKAEASRIKGGKRAAILADAQAGVMPMPPDFTAPTHARFRNKLAAIIALVEAGDIKALKKFAINPISSSPKAMDRYRNLAVIALEAAAKAKG